jgi:hypothetical protein
MHVSLFKTSSRSPDGHKHNHHVACGVLIAAAWKFPSAFAIRSTALFSHRPLGTRYSKPHESPARGVARHVSLSSSFGDLFSASLAPQGTTNSRKDRSYVLPPKTAFEACSTGLRSRTEDSLADPTDDQTCQRFIHQLSQRPPLDLYGKPGTTVHGS